MALPDGTGELTIDQITDLFASDDKEDKLEDKKDKELEDKTLEKEEDEEEIVPEKGKEKKEKEKEEEIELAGDEDNPEIEEELKLITPFKRKEILAKYPEVFKDFPYLEVAYFRDKEFTEIFPTVNDAKEAVEKSELLDNFSASISNGEIDRLLSAFKESGDKTFNKVIDNYMPALAKASPEGYHHVIGNIIKNTIVQMVQESRRTSNEQLQTYAQILNQFIFGTSEFAPPTRLNVENENSKEKDEIEQERARFTRERFESTRDDLDHKIKNVLKSTIDNHIDPRKSMSDYVKKHATSEALDSLEKLIRQDTRFVGILDNLWKKAFESRFDKNSTDKIRAAYLSKAKSLLLPVIRKARNDALSGLGKRVKDDKDDSNEDTNRRGSSERASSSSQKDKKDGVPKGMRTIDYLMQD